MATLQFTKMHGCGNDYIYVVATESRPADPAALSIRLSDRRFGIGGDGLILLCRSAVADVAMEIYNADGSRAEICGNGLRCLARLAWERGLTQHNPMTVQTDGGICQVLLHIDCATPCAATVDMGAPILEGAKIPAAAQGRIVDYPLAIANGTRLITAVSMGNPHCVVFVEDDSIFELPDDRFAALGRQFERHPFFPRGVNTEFTRILTPDHMRVRVWERGSGATLACGSGACATLVAAALTGRSQRKATIDLPGGSLEIEWRQDGPQADHVLMTGEAVEVFQGCVELPPSELVAVAAA